MTEYKYEAKLVTHDPGGRAGELHNITEDLAMLYDLVVSSMDWGSGFLDDEQMEAVVKIGILCGFDVPTCTATWSHYSPDTTKIVANEYGTCQKPMFHSGGHAGKIARRSGDPYRPDTVKVDSFDHEWEAEHKEGGQ